MEIAIEASPLKSGHQFRGIGVYTQNLITALTKIDQKNKYLLMEKPGLVEKKTLIHYPYFHPFFLTLPLFKRNKIVVTIHDLTPLVFPKHYPPGIRGKLRFSLQKFLLQRVEAVITDSKSSKEDIYNYLGYPKKKISVIYLAAPPEFKELKLSEPEINQVRLKYKLPPKFVLYVGDVNYNKNILGLAAACKKNSVPLVIVGKQAAQEDFDPAHIENQPLVQLIKQYGNDPDIFRLGFIPYKDLAGLYRLADLYCQPSFYEGFGLSVLEAMISGCPVVSSGTSSLTEVCGRAAVLVDPYQTEALAKGVKLVLNNQKLRGQLIKKGLKQAEKFSWPKTARQTIKVYEKVYRQKK